MRYLLGACVATTCLTLVSTAQAVEPYIEFIEGLRRRDYFDTALDYIEQIKERPDLPQDVAQRLPFERGVTLLEGAQQLKSAQAQMDQLDEAEAAFEQFTGAVPADHPLQGRANTERARILLNKARVQIWQAESPANVGKKEALREEARRYISQAETVFEKARAAYETEWQKYPKFIPEDQRQLIAERSRAENNFMEAQLNLARCTYEKAQSYPEESKERADLLDQAAAEFDEIHQKYRTQIVGLYARLWQGKCFEEQDEIRKALGIYNEILDHPGNSPAMRKLQDLALRFRLMSLNHPDRADYQLVIDEATEWLKEARSRARTEVGLGIEWELGRALESVGMQRTQSEADRTNYLRQALTRARNINRYPGELKAPSQAMIQRVMVAMDRDPDDPKDFDTAFGAADQLLEESKVISNEIEAAVAENDRKKVQELQQNLAATGAEMARLYDLALRLATPETEEDRINSALLRLAYGYLLQQDYLSSSVAGDYVSRRVRESNPELAVEAGYISLASLGQEFYSAPEDDREFEMQRLLDTANFIVDNWPQLDRANDARLSIARVYRTAGQPDKAAEWYAKIPESAAQYAQAQIDAGQAYWSQYLQETMKPAADRAAAEELARWKTEAEQHLERGIEKRGSQLPADAPPPAELAKAKLTLAQIRNMDGVYTATDGEQGAIELLTAGPHSVVVAVAVGEGEQRPEQPGEIKSRAMASLAYQQLLRAHIGNRDLEAAATTRQKLEEVAAGGDEAALTQVYVAFGQELQRELQQLRAAGEDQRVKEVREGFEAFLNDLFERKEGQTYNSLLWIAETYGGLADGSEDDSAAAQVYYDKAARTYAEILSRGSDPTFVDPEKLPGVQVRLANMKRRQGDFEGAEAVLLEVLEEKPNALDAQIEAARLYQEWGGSGSPDAWKQYEVAINGREQPVNVWGWGKIANRLQRFIMYGEGNEAFEQQHREARYNLALSHKLYAEQQSTPDEHEKQLDMARDAIYRYVAITDNLPDEGYDRFNELYREILSAMGEEVTDLPRFGNATDVQQAGTGANGEPMAQAGADNTGDEQAAAADDGASTNWFIIVALLLLAVGSIAGLYLLSVQQSRKKREKYLAAAPAPRQRKSSKQRTAQKK